MTQRRPLYPIERIIRTDVRMTPNALNTAAANISPLPVTKVAPALSAAATLVNPDGTTIDDAEVPAPSTPILDSRLGTVSIRWDGLTSTGDPMPPIAYVSVHVSTTSGFTPDGANQVGTFAANTPDTVILSDLTYNTTYYAKFVAVNRSDVHSLPSAEAGISVTPLVNTDIIGQIINGANIVNGSLVASDKIVGNTITGALIQSLSINTGHLAANAITADKIQAGAITAQKIDTYAINGKYIQGGTVYGSKFYSQGTGVGGRGWIEIGNTGDADPVDEIRFWYGSYVTSIRQPTGAPGSMRFSLGQSGGATGWLQLQLRDGTAGNILLKPASTGAGGAVKIMNNSTDVQIRTSDDGDYGNFAAKKVSYQTLVQFSSARLKESVSSLETDGSLLNLRPVRFNWKSDGRPQIGLIAEEVEAAGLTDAVAYSADGTVEGVRIDALMTLMLAEIQKLSARIDRLEKGSSLG